MNGYSNLASSSSPPMAGNGTQAKRSLELTNTKETNAWEGLAIGVVTMVRTFSTGSHRLCKFSERSRRGSVGHHSGLPRALRRAFSMRRHPAAPDVGDEYYWMIHNMDGESDHGDDNAGEERHGEEKKKGQREKGEVKEKAKGRRKKKRGDILKACKKLLQL